MSIESEVKKLTTAITGLTEAIVANQGRTPMMLNTGEMTIGEAIASEAKGAIEEIEEVVEEKPKKAPKKEVIVDEDEDDISDFGADDEDEEEKSDVTLKEAQKLARELSRSDKTNAPTIRKYVKKLGADEMAGLSTKKLNKLYDFMTTL